ncbi:MAG TPA: hypothetical protein ENF82_03015 [Candidatus Methanomethylia archaeon]|nr:hypothetical protein [Candidatus Methanomethylicia archaeon]
MARTVALSEQAYRKLKELKEALNLSYSDLLLKLIEDYERHRLHELKELCRKLKTTPEEASRIEEIVAQLRGRSWW